MTLFSLFTHLDPCHLLVIEELVGSLFQVEVLIVVLRVLKVPGVVGGLEQPGSRPRQFVTVVCALVVLSRVLYGLVVQTPIGVRELVELASMLETFGAVGGIDGREDYARGS